MSLSGKDGEALGTRAGTLALSLIGMPINAVALTRLDEGPQGLSDLQSATAAPATTIRRHLRALADLGVVAKRRAGDFPGRTRYELTKGGEALVGVAASVSTWLAAAPAGPIALDAPSARTALKAFIDAWSTSMLRALAARPLALTELDRLIAGVSYPSLERRLAALRLAEQVRRLPSNGSGAPHVVTDWLRLGVGPIVMATRWERTYARDRAAAITNRDVEALFLLSIPLVQLAPEMTGICRVAVEISNSSQRFAGALVEVARGRVVYCGSRLEGDAGAWATGSTSDWLAALIERELDRLEIGGDARLAIGLLEGLHSALFRPQPVVR